MTHQYLDTLHPYPFEKLKALKADITPNPSLHHIPLSVGEPKHQPPAFVLDTLTKHIGRVSQYPTTKGLPELNQAISQWVSHRFDLREGSLSAEQHVLPVTGTREALFAFTQLVIDQSNDLTVQKIMATYPTSMISLKQNGNAASYSFYVRRVTLQDN